MAWFKVDDGFWAHPKTFVLSDAAVALWLKAGTWASQMLTDGKIPANAVSIFRASDEAAQELVASGLWRTTSEGYAFHDWDEYQPSAEVEKTKRAARAESARRAACARWHGPECGGQCESHGVAHSGPHSESDADNHADAMRGAMPRPVPSRPEESKDSLPPEKILRETRLPADWVPTKAHFDYAKEHNLDIEKQVDKFRDHAHTHDRKVKRWNGAFTSWLKKAVEFGQQRQTAGQQVFTPGRRQTIVEKTLALTQEMSFGGLEIES